MILEKLSNKWHGLNGNEVEANLQTGTHHHHHSVEQ
jgi:hypothetical protein